MEHSVDVESQSGIVEIQSVEDHDRQVAKCGFLTSRNRPNYPQKRFTDLESPKASIWKITMITMEASLVILAMSLLACVLSISSLGRKTIWRIPILELAVSSLLTAASRYASFAVATILGLSFSWMFTCKPLVVYIVGGLKKDARFLMTMVFVIMPWLIVIIKKTTKEQDKDKVLHKVIEVLTSVLIIFFLWFIKCIITTCCSAWFHLKTYQEWIEESLFYWYVIEAFSGNPWSWIKIEHVFDPKRTSPWDMKKMIMDQTHFGLGVKIRNEAEAETAAKRTFRNIAKQGSEFIELDDISRFIPRHALKALSLFRDMEENENIQISAYLFQEWVVHAFKHEKKLIATLKNMAGLANKINRTVNIVAWIVLSILFLPLAGVVGSKRLSFLTTGAFVATIVFLFGTMWKSVLDSIVLIFVVHPFDIGDRCEIQETEMIVEEINIISTLFVGLDGKKYIYTNLDLCTKVIVNHDRSQGTTWGEIHLEKEKEKDEKEKEREEKAKEREEKEKAH